MNLFGSDFANVYADVIVLLIVSLWVLPWKGVALWKAATRKEKKWFIILLVVHTVGILEILYIFIFSKGKFAIFAKKETQSAEDSTSKVRR